METWQRPAGVFEAIALYSVPGSITVVRQSSEKKWVRPHTAP